MLVSSNSQIVGAQSMNRFDDDTIFALGIAFEIYDSAASDPVTAPAAFGVGCLILQDMLKVNLRAAALLLDVGLQARGKN